MEPLPVTFYWAVILHGTGVIYGIFPKDARTQAEELAKADADLKVVNAAIQGYIHLSS